MANPANEWVSDLADFRTRPEAKRKLVALGEDAVPVLAEGLKTAPTAARWSMVSALEEIGTDAAVRALVDTLGNSSLAPMAAESLSRITGQSFETDKNAWEAWLRGGGKPSGPPPAPEPAECETLLRKALENTDAEWTKAGKEYEVKVPLPPGRAQRVRVSFGGRDSEGSRLIVIYTPAGPADPANFEWALRRNLRMAYGAIGVHDMDGEPMFVAVNTLLADTADPRDLRKSVLYLAKRADTLEKKLTGSDKL